MNPTAIYSKSGKGVQEAAGKTSLLKRPDRAVLAAIDGRATLKEVAEKVGRGYDAAFQAVIQQLDKEGFIREVSGGAAAAPTGVPSRPLSQPSRPAAPAPSKPAPSTDLGSDLDFSALGGTKIGGMKPAAAPSRPAAPPPPPPKPAAPSPQQVQQTKAQQSALDKAREEAEARAAAERERLRKEAEDKARAELEAKMRADAEKKLKEEAEARAKAEAEAKIRAAREAAVKAAAEAKAKAEAEAKAKLEAERKAREEMERRLEAERKAREEAERKAKEEAERARREAEEKARREAEELRQRLEAERKAREEAERKAKEEAERLRREAEEHARKVREEAERKAKEEAERVRRELEAERQRLAEERRRQEEELAARAALQAAQAAPKAEAPAAPAKGGGFADSLMADLASFTNKDEEEHKAKAEAERQAKVDAELRRQEAERTLREEAIRREEQARQREEQEARRRDGEQRKAREEEERIAREEERRRREAEEIQRKAEAATAAAMAKQAAAPEEDIPISDEDLSLDEVKKERKALGIDEKKLREQEKEAEREARKRKRAEEKKRREAEKQAAKQAARTAAPSGRPRRPAKWGRPVTLLLGLILVGALAAAHLMPLDVAPVEQAASEAVGQPVRIGSARLWLFTGIQLRFDSVRVGRAQIGRVVAHPALGSLFGDRQSFNLIELDGVSLPQATFGEALFQRVKSERFTVERIRVRELTLPGALALPKPLEADVTLNANGGLRTATVRGPDGLNVRIAPKGDGLEFEATAGGLPLPVWPDVTLSKFAAKGTATRFGVDIAEWGGAIFDGAISGTAKMRWGSTWDLDGVVTVRNINAAVFAPALLSEGKADGTGHFSMSGAEPAKLLAASRFDGRFSINKGTLGSFDLSRAIQTRGKQFTGTTQFAELNGQGTYDRGTVALRNVTIGAGALNAGASADISKTGALSGRIVADVRTAAQTLSATLLLGGTVKEPQVRD